MSFVFTDDSHGIFLTITTLHEKTDCQLHPTVFRVRNSFKSGDILAAKWISRAQNIAEFLKKHFDHLQAFEKNVHRLRGTKNHF